MLLEQNGGRNQPNYQYQIRGSHDGDFEEYSLLEHDGMYSGDYITDVRAAVARSVKRLPNVWTSEWSDFGSR
jgi:hypothetical protein